MREAADQDGLLLVYPTMAPPDDPKRRRDGEMSLQRPPLGLFYVMGALREAGLSFSFVDQVVQGLSHHDVVSRVRRGRFDIVGLHVNEMAQDSTLRLLRSLCRETDAQVLVGGPHALADALYLDAGASVVLRGEAETRIATVLRAMRSGTGLDGIPGLSFRDASGEIQRTGAAPLLADLDRLPRPVRPLGLAHRYGEPVNPAQRGIYLGMMASRGCPHHCAYCDSHVLWGRQVRVRSAADVVAEMVDLRTRWPGGYFSFVDDCFGPSVAWVEEFCDRVSALEGEVRWGCILHPLSFGTRLEEMIERMGEAGCRCISFGAQSAVPEILAGIDRSPREPARLAEGLAASRRAGILSIVTYIYGLPGETHETMAENLRFALAHKPHLADFHPLFVLKHSPLGARYPDGVVPGLPPDVIARACRHAFRVFYTQPGTIHRNLAFILRNNPAFVLRAMAPLRNLLSYAFRHGAP